MIELCAACELNREALCPECRAKEAATPRKIVPAEAVPDRSTEPMRDPYGGTPGERYVASKRDRNDDTKLAP